MRSSRVGRAIVAGITWLLVVAAPVLAATPAPTTAAGGDPRSSGQGPGLVGDPFLAIAAVIAIGVLTLGGTLLYVRLSGGPRKA